MDRTPRPSQPGVQRRQWLQGVAALGLAGNAWAQGTEPSAKKSDGERPMWWPRWPICPPTSRT